MQRLKARASLFNHISISSTFKHRQPIVAMMSSASTPGGPIMVNVPVPDVLVNGESNGGGEKTVPTEPKGIVKIEFRRKEGLFGFNIVGGSDQAHIPGNTGIFVTRIRPDSPAGMDGRLKVGDQIISANDHDLTNVKHNEAVDILRNLNNVCTLMVDPGAERRILMEPPPPSMVWNLPENPISQGPTKDASQGKAYEVKVNVAVPVPAADKKNEIPPPTNGPIVQPHHTLLQHQEGPKPSVAATAGAGKGASSNSVAGEAESNNSTWPPTMPEPFYIAVGGVALAVVGYFIYQRMVGRSGHPSSI